jgi:cytochrome c oxidase accessory protein FixG
MLESGNRKWIYAKQPKGKWYTRRTVFGWVCILFLVFAPLIKLKGNPLMLLDVANRKFFIFGQLIWAQDSYLLALIMLIVVVSIVLFTVVFGRLWCGWACPQTLFMEMVFRRIEYLFDGNYRQHKKKSTQSTKNIIRTLGKHAAFLLTSILISNVFLNWFVGPERLWQIVSAPIRENLMGFSFMMAISIFYYFIYSYFREQVCTMFCPYGRMQGVLLDSKSIAVIYDYKRGEPRGAKTHGDCIDCKQCISVCPTGIDIKDGSQLECINCTACIDECNSVMHKIGKPENLIRFDSVHGIETGQRIIFNARTYAYSAVLAILMLVLAITLFNRTAIDSTILRVPGTLYQEVGDGVYSNLYNVKIINKTQVDKNLDFRLLQPQTGEIQFVGENHTLKKDGKFEGVLIIKLKKENTSGKSTPIEIGIFENNELLETYETNFIGPVQ